MDIACNSDSDSDSQSRLDLAHRTAVAASMLLNLAAAAPENHGGRKRGAAFHAMVSNLDGIAWQLPIKQDAPSTGSRPHARPHPRCRLHTSSVLATRPTSSRPARHLHQAPFTVRRAPSRRRSRRSESSTTKNVRADAYLLTTATLLTCAWTPPTTHL